MLAFFAYSIIPIMLYREGTYKKKEPEQENHLLILSYVSVGANSVLNSNCPDGCMVAGIPAHKIKDSEAWYIRDGAEYTRRVQECERLRSRQLNHSSKRHDMP